MQTIPLLNVYGEASIKTAPDYAVLSVQVDRVLTPGEASAASASFLFNDADIQIKLAGSDDNEIRESIPYVQLQAQTQVFAKQFTITVKNISKLQDVVIDLARRNLGHITYISYRSSLMESIYAQARKQAMANARTRALAYADAAGQNVGKANTIREEALEVTSGFDDAYVSHENDTRGEKYVVNPGSLTVYCKVWVAYDLAK